MACAVSAAISLTLSTELRTIDGYPGGARHDVVGDVVVELTREGVVVGAGQRVLARQVDVIGDQHQRAGLQVGAHAAGRA